MRRIALLSCAASLAFLPLATPAASAPPAAAAESRLALARELIRLSTPIEAVKRDARRSFEEGFRRSFLAGPNGRSAEQRFPGLLDAMLAAAGAEMDTVYAETMPRIMDDAASAYAEALSEKQLRSALAFFETQVGRKAVALIPKATDLKTMRVDYRGLLTPDEMRAYSAFAATDAAKASARLNARLFRELTATLGKAIDAAMPRMEQKSLEAADAFLAARGARRQPES